jgi:hypothetical protein
MADRAARLGRHLSDPTGAEELRYRHARRNKSPEKCVNGTAYGGNAAEAGRHVGEEAHRLFTEMGATGHAERVGRELEH